MSDQTTNNDEQKKLDATIIALNPNRSNVVTVDFSLCEKIVSKARAKVGLLPADPKSSVTVASIEYLQSSSKMSLFMKAAGFKKQLRLLNPKVVLAINNACGVTITYNQAALVGLALCVLGTDATDAIMEEMIDNSPADTLADLVKQDGFDRALIDHLASLFPVLEEIIELIKTFVSA